MSDIDKSQAVFESLLTIIEKSGKQYDVDSIVHAYETAKEAHMGQRRVSGEPYVMHPVHVAEILVHAAWYGYRHDCCSFAA